MDDILKKIADLQMLNTLKLLSAIFEKYGEIKIKKKDFDNAEIRFHVGAEEKDGYLILKKIAGKSQLYHDIFKDEGKN